MVGKPKEASLNTFWLRYGLMFCFILIAVLRVHSQAIVVNSYFNAISPNEEWTELVVVADNLDLRGWSLRDNNSNQNSWQDEIVFNNISFWNNLRAGTIIVINHRLEGSLETNIDKTDGFIRVDANDPSYFSGGNFPNNTLNVANGGDLIQIRNISGNHVHVLGHKSEPGNSYGPIPVPKLNHLENILANEAIMVCPGGVLSHFGTPAQSGTAFTAKSSLKVAGLPNTCGSSNSDFWRGLRQPSWSNITSNGLYNPISNQVTLEWSPLTDPNPSDNYQGYLILRNTVNSFLPPVDGQIYQVNDLINGARVVGISTGTGNVTFFDTCDIGCNQSVYYRIYGFRYNGSHANTARGRAYNETNFASITVTNIPPTVIQPSPDNKAICSGEFTNFSVTSNTEGASISWTSDLLFGSATGHSSGTGSIINQQIFNESNSTAIILYKLFASYGNCMGSFVSFYVYVNPKPQLTSNTSPPPVCSGNLFTYIPQANVAGTTITWARAAVPGISNPPAFGPGIINETLINTTNEPIEVVYVISMNAANCERSQNISVIVTPVFLPLISIEADKNIICSGETIIFIADTLNAGSQATIEWYVNGQPSGVNSNPFISSGLSENSVVYCVITTPDVCAVSNSVSSNSIAIQVHPPVILSLEISSDNTNICSGDVVNFWIASSSGIGSAPAYQWKINGQTVAGAVNPTFSHIFTQNAIVSCSIISNESCLAVPNMDSGIIQIVVNELITPTIAVSSDNQNICSGTPVNFTAQITGGGITPFYQWRINEINVTGANSSTYQNATLSNNDLVDCVLTSSEECTTSAFVVSSPVQMIVNTTHTPNAHISANFPTSICQGETIVFTSLVNGGGANPLFEWILDGEVVSNNENFSYVANVAGSHTVRLRFTSSEGCTSQNPVLSNLINFNVNPSLPVSISISANPNTACAGTVAITITASISNGGSSPVYQWFRNGTEIQGVNTANYTAFGQPGDQWQVILTSNALCAIENTVPSNILTPNVLPSAIQPELVSSDAESVCANSGEQITLTASGGSGNTLEWYTAGCGVNFIGTGNEITVPAPNQTTTYYARWTTPSCGVSPCATVVVSVNEAIVPSVFVSANQTNICQGEQINFLAQPGGQGSSPTYQWKVNGINAGGNSPSFNYIPNDGDVVVCFLTSSESCASPEPVQSNEIVLNVNPNLISSINVQASQTAVCSGTEVLFTASATNGGDQASYQWMVDGVANGNNQPSFAFTPSATSTVSCIMTSSLECVSPQPAASNVITIEVLETTTPSVSVAANATQVCQGTTIVFSANAAGTGSSPVYEWFVGGELMGNNPTFEYTPNNGDQIVCVLTSSDGCADPTTVSSNPITVSVLPVLQPDVNISASDNNVCEGTEIVFEAFPQNGGDAPVYSWMVNGESVGGNSSTLILTPENGNQVQCFLTSNEICAASGAVASQPIDMIVNAPSEPAVVIEANQTNVCFGSEITFNALAVNGGVNPSYQWIVDGLPSGQNQPTLTLTITVETIVSCILSSSLDCITQEQTSSNEVTVNVAETIVPSVSVAASTTQVCEGTLVVFSTSQSGGGSTPIYEWFVGGELMGNNPTFEYTPNNGDQIVCVLTSSDACADPQNAISEPITVSVLPVLQPDVNISASDNNVCEGTEIVFEAFPQNGGDAPVYSWMVNGESVGGNSSTLILTPENGNQVQCFLTSNEICAASGAVASQPIDMVVNAPSVPAVVVEASQTNVCFGSEITFNALAVNGGENPSYQWIVDGLPSGQNQPTLTLTITAETTVSCILSSSLECITQEQTSSNEVTVNVTETLVPSVSVAASSTQVCEGTVVVFSTSQSGGGSTPIYEWFVGGELMGNNPTFEFTPNDGDQIVCVFTSSDACADPATVSSNPITVSVLLVLQPVVNISASDNNVCEGTEIVFEAFPQNGGDAPVYSWLLNGVPVGGNNSTLILTPENGNQVQCFLTSNEICAAPEAVASQPIDMIVNAPSVPAVVVEASQTHVCFGSEITFNALAVNGGENPSYQWIVDGLPSGQNQPNLTLTITAEITVSCILSSSLDCITQEQISSNEVTINVAETIVPFISISTSSNIVCGSSAVTFEATATGQGSDPVWDWKINGVSLGAEQTFTYTPQNEDVVECILTSAEECANPQVATSEAITMQVSPEILLTEILHTNALCQSDNGTINVLAEGGVSPLFYTIDNGITWQENSFFEQLPPGFYSIMIKDVNNCSLEVSDPLQITRVGGPEITQMVAEPTSGGYNNGSAIVYAEGDNGPFLYSINNLEWQSSNTFSGLSEGIYQIYVKDQNDCATNITLQVQAAATRLFAGAANACVDVSFTVLIETDGFSAMGSIQLELEYETHLMHFEDMEAINPLFANSTVEINETYSGRISLKISGNNPYNMQGGGMIASLRFKSHAPTGVTSLGWNSETVLTKTDATPAALSMTSNAIRLFTAPELRVQGITEYCQGEPVLIEIQSGSNNTTANWVGPNGEIMNGSALHINDVAYEMAGSYLAVVTNTDGCISEKEIQLVVNLCDYKPEIPNAFRPASNPPNNTFNPVFGSVVPLDFQMTIFNRWGMVIYETNDYSKGWDGTMNNSPQPMGVYTYMIKMSIYSNSYSPANALIFTGTVTLLR
jgi:gliding motility-associated-like protein